MARYKHKPHTLQVTIEVEFLLDDLDALDWYCDEETGEPDRDIVANNVRVVLGPEHGHEHTEWWLKVTKAVYAATPHA